MEESPYKAPLELGADGELPPRSTMRRWWPAIYLLFVVVGAVVLDPLLDSPSHVSLAKRGALCLIVSGFHVTIGFALFGAFLLVRRWHRRFGA